MANSAKFLVDSGPGAIWNAISFTAGDLNSLPSGGAALGSTVITNSSNLDLLIDFSFVVTVGGTTVTQSSIISVSLLDLNQDGSHYGDNYASSTTTQPAITYQAGWTPVLGGVTSGNAVYGTISKCPLAPGDYKATFNNNLNVALNSSAALTLKYRLSYFNLNA